MRETRIPDFALVVLVGASGSGKSTFARTHFKPTEIVSSDVCRGIVADDENDQSATGPAFDLVHVIIDKRLAARRLTVVDATNVRAEDRRHYVTLARRHHALPVALVFDVGEAVCHERNANRPDRQFGPHVVRNHTRSIRRGLRGLQKEGYRHVHVFRSAEEMDQTVVLREPLWTDRRVETGAFDIIGDVHGCGDELEALLAELGYAVRFDGDGEARTCTVTPPDGRRAVFVGDLVDRGPRTPDVLRLVMGMVAAGTGFCVRGNHDEKLLKWMNGRKVKIAHGLAESIAQLEAEPEPFRNAVRAFLDGLISHYWLDEGRLAVAHAGLKETMIGRASGAIRSFSMFGETTGETDEFGLPVRHNWAADYRGPVQIAYGHTPVPEADWLNRTICLDTGCVFGGKLTALRWPERELVSVPAARVYAEPVRPLHGPGEALSAQAAADDLLDIEDVSGKRIVETRLAKTVTILEDQATPALETMVRFAINPKWLVYLPPTMSPSATSERSGLLEHPDEAFGYFAHENSGTVVCEEKHMGSRAVLVVCRDAEMARERFGVTTGETGAVHTRTGRPFFPDRETSEAILARLRAAVESAGWWDRFETGWLLLDAEIMPWSAKARSLIADQYAGVASAARSSLSDMAQAMAAVDARGIDTGGAPSRIGDRLERAERFAAAYRHYCWPVRSLDDYRIAPFQLLATEGAVHADRDHAWHMQTLAELAAGDDPVIMATAHRIVDLADAGAIEAATEWWTDMTSAGGEGMVVKPMIPISRGSKGLIQPALKCRGPEYLRIIYGPEYDLPGNLDRLRRRGLGRKRSLAIREFALGYEALHRFVAREPLRRVHECVFGVLALESEPVDPRL